MTYEKWMQEVDKHVQEIAGLSVYDLADYDYRADYDADEDVKTVAEDSLIYNGYNI